MACLESGGSRFSRDAQAGGTHTHTHGVPEAGRTEAEGVRSQKSTKSKQARPEAACRGGRCRSRGTPWASRSSGGPHQAGAQAIGAIGRCVRDWRHALQLVQPVAHVARRRPTQLIHQSVMASRLSSIFFLRSWVRGSLYHSTFGRLLADLAPEF